MDARVLATADWPETRMNQMEQRYANRLEMLLRGQRISWWAFEPWKFRIGVSTFYTPDFGVVTIEGTIELHETNPTWTSGRMAGKAGYREDSRVKIKAAASRYPFLRFVSARERPQREGRTWELEVIQTDR